VRLSAILLSVYSQAATILKILQVSAGSVSALLLVVMMVSSAGAVPLLTVGSNADYRLNASIQSNQSCSATPAISPSTQVNYTQLACGPYRPVVSIYDNGTCVASYNCYYSPSYFYYSIQVGTTVMWFNYGTVAHTVTSSLTNKAGLQTFDSGPIVHYGSYSVTFTTAGNYTYYDTLHPLLRGNLIVSSTSPTPISSSFMPTISLAGSLNWTAIGLDNSVAVLNVSHQVSIFASAGPFSFTPATETGSLSQSIDLSTRVESAGTATSAILGIIQNMFNYYPGYYGYGYPSALGQLLSSHKERYTFWWVNGPLSNGQPVEILTGYASVTGSEIVNLGPGNNRNAWIVESTLSQSLSTTSPPVITAGGSSDSSFKLDLRFDYDQATDLLLKSSAVVSVVSAQSQGYNPGDYLCGPSGCFPVSDHVTVNHHMSATVSVTLKLESTNLDMSKRAPQGSTGNGQTSPATTLPPAMSLWIYASIGIVGVGAVGTLAWLLRRRARIRAPIAQPGPLPGPSPPITSA
jgi:plastocyanin